MKQILLSILCLTCLQTFVVVAAESNAWRNSLELEDCDLTVYVREEPNFVEPVHQKGLDYEKMNEAIKLFSTGRTLKNSGFLQEAFEKFENSSALGHLEAQFQCGVMLYSGDGILQYKHGAFADFSVAAKKGHLEAKFKCGMMLYNGDGVEQNKGEALKYFSDGAQFWHLGAQFQCGRMLYNGDGVELDCAKAFIYYRAAANCGHRDAQFNCGDILYNGRDVVKNYAGAFRYLFMAAENGDVESQFKCCDMLAREDVAPDSGVVFKCLEMVAAQSWDSTEFANREILLKIRAQCGRMLYIGDGVEKNHARAFDCYQSAANRGNSDAQFNCGCMLYNGEGVNRDYDDAFRYWEWAAYQGHLLASWTLYERIPEKWPRPAQPKP